MKYVIRRAILGIVSIPFVAGAWVFFYLLLLLAGAEPNQSIGDTFNNGMFIGGTLAVVLTFYPQLYNLMNKIIS